MAVTFLTDEWATAVTEALQAHDEFKSAADMSVRFVGTDAPGGETKFYMDGSGD